MTNAAGILFLFCGCIAVATAVATVWMASPLRSAMALLGHIISLAGLYLTLNAHFLAALQLLVYAGAVVVLFVFTIMLIGPAAEIPPNNKTLGIRTFGLAVAAIATLGAASALSRVTAPFVAVTSKCAQPGLAECGQFGGVSGLGRVLYTEAVVPFELVSMLLVVAIVGAVAVARGRTKKEAAELVERKLERDGKAAAAVGGH